ncbi:hypothetical protein CTI12_AA201600 [Artemisia annua]|uniref:Uncharacterized protein n=1 Tax=Artemisia annua TaxID=35608 RepID=A0A2U1N8X5_ARTAN|nr:hypothetical protein CTI12_AA201600 [Artemisia annua]
MLVQMIRLQTLKTTASAGYQGSAILPRLCEEGAGSSSINGRAAFCEALPDVADNRIQVSTAICMRFLHTGNSSLYRTRRRYTVPVRSAVLWVLTHQTFGVKNWSFVSTVPAARLGFKRNTVECRESRIGKQPIEVPR